MYQRAGRLAEAKEHFVALTRGDPGNFAAHVRLCDILIRLGHLAEAEAVLRTAQRLDPQHPDTATIARSLESARAR